MSDLKPYPDYKNSGVDWLGAIPSGWKLKRVGDCTTPINGFPFDASLFGPEGNPLVRIRDLDATEAAVRFGGRDVPAVWVTAADLLIGMDGDFNVGRWRGAEPALLNQRMMALRGEPDLLRLLEHALPDPLRRINELTYATTVKHLSSSQVEAIRVALPDSAQELKALVAYLERETAEIDAFISDQEVLTELLAERRAATINHAVTKGLDQTVTTKDSGIEWLGAIPAHWVPLALKRVLRTIDQGVSPQAEGGLADDDSIGVLRAGCVNRGVFNELEHKRLPDDFAFDDSIRVKVGDLIVNRASGSPSLVGSAARVRALHYALILSDKTFRLHPLPATDPNFIELFLNSNPYRRQVLNAISGAEGLANNLPMTALKEIRLALPPTDEQARIAEAIGEDLAEIDSAIADAREAIALSRERRAALISAAVTGKIDVRDAA